MNEANDPGDEEWDEDPGPTEPPYEYGGDPIDHD